MKIFSSSSKYKNRRQVVNGYTFDSKAEAEYYISLLFQEKKGLIKIGLLQPKVYLSNAKILYKPDFLIVENGKEVYIDVKGFNTPTFAIKKRLWKAYVKKELRIVCKNYNGFYIKEVINEYAKS